MLFLVSLNIFAQYIRGTGYDSPVHTLELSAIRRSDWVYTHQITSRSTVKGSTWVSQPIVNPSSFHIGRSGCKILISHCLSFTSVLFKENTNTKHCILRCWRARLINCIVVSTMRWMKADKNILKLYWKWISSPVILTLILENKEITR